MTPAEKLGLPRWLPPFCWSSPWAWALFILLIDAGVLFFSMWALERVVYRQYYWSNLLGDVLALPLIAYCIAVLLGNTHHPIHAWYTSTEWYVGLYAALSVGWYVITFTTAGLTTAQRLSPSCLWHTLFLPAFAFTLIAPAPAALAYVSRSDLATVFLAGIGIGIWATSLAVDLTTHPEALGGIVEFSWRQWWQNLAAGHPFSGSNPSTIRMDTWRGVPKPPGFIEHFYPNGRPR